MPQTEPGFTDRAFNPSGKEPVDRIKELGELPTRAVARQSGDGFDLCIDVRCESLVRGGVTCVGDPRGFHRKRFRQRAAIRQHQFLT